MYTYSGFGVSELSSSKIKVLHMGLADKRGGIESFLLNMASNIDRSVFQFDFLCYGDDPACYANFAEYGCNLINMPSRCNLAAYKKFIMAELAKGYSIFHLHKNSPIDFLPVLWGSKSHALVVSHSHNASHDIGGAGRVAASFGRFVFSNCSDLRLACSSDAGEWLFGSNADFEVFPNAIELQRYSFDAASRHRLRASLDISETSFVIGLVGRLVPQKNIPFMLRVFSRLIHSGVDAVLVLVGEGEEYEQINQLIIDLNIQSKVRMTGRREDVNEIYSAFDLACAPSIYEGFSFFVLEAQASGLPCLVSSAVPCDVQITSLCEALELDEDVWTSRILDLIKEGRLRQSLGHGDGSAMSRYDVSAAADSLMNLYKDLIDDNKKGSQE